MAARALIIAVVTCLCADLHVHVCASRAEAAADATVCDANPDVDGENWQQLN